MKYLRMFLKLLPALAGLVNLAENAFDKRGAGVEKKALVVGGVKTIVQGIEAVSTGGQKEIWAELDTPIGLAVDAISGIMFEK